MARKPPEENPEENPHPTLPTTLIKHPQLHVRPLFLPERTVDNGGQGGGGVLVRQVALWKNNAYYALF